MLKEIFEQPQVIKDTLSGRVDESGKVHLGAELGEIDVERLASLSKIAITGCGTAYHAGMVGMYLLRSLVHLPVEMELASEFRYGDPVIDPTTLVIAMSQSGETADTIEAVRIAKAAGCGVLGICNVLGSHLTRLANGILYTRGGPEIGVAATKTYVSQVTAMTLFALYLARVRGTVDEARLAEIAEGTKLLPAAVDVVLDESAEIRQSGPRAAPRAQSVLFIGRYVNFPTALEGALKLKEISYIHAEGYPAGEMKHGPIALLDSTVPVVGIVTEDRVREKMLSNLMESRVRAKRLRHRSRKPRRRRRPRAWPITCSWCQRSTSSSHRSSTSFRCSCSPTISPTSKARTSISRVTSPKPSPSNNDSQRRARARRVATGIDPSRASSSTPKEAR